MSDDRMKAVIAALLETDGRTPEEAASARAKAAKLMAKHDLTEEEVLADNPDLVGLATEVSRYEWIVTQVVSYRIAKLTGTVGHYHSCYGKGWTRRSDRKRQVFSGYRPDVEHAAFLLHSILEQAKVGARAVKGSTAKTAYLRAFGNTVSRRLRDLTDTVEEVRTDTQNALVVKKEAIIYDFVGPLGKEREIKPRAYDEFAAQKGREDGRNAKLRRELGDGVIAIGKGVRT